MERALRMIMAFTYLPGFVTLVFRGMPTVWRGRHRLLRGWLLCRPAGSPGRQTWAAMARGPPATRTAWRWGRRLPAASGTVPLLGSWLAPERVAPWPIRMKLRALITASATFGHAASWPQPLNALFLRQ